MANDVATVAPQKIVSDLAARYNLDPAAFEQTIIDTCFSEKDAAHLTRSELYAFLMVANQHGLNPMLREIYAMRKKGGGVQAVVGVDGWLNLVNRNPQFDGMTFQDNTHQTDPKKPPELFSITCFIHRKDRSHPTAATEYMAECRQPTDPWAKWPARMLRHKSVIQAARMAFGFAGIVDPDEAARLKPGDLDGIGRADPIERPQAQIPATDDKPRRGRPPKPTVAPPAPLEPNPALNEFARQQIHDTMATAFSEIDLVEYLDPDTGELRHVTLEELDRLTAEENRIAAEAEQRRLEEESAARVEATKRERAAKAEALRKQLAELDGLEMPERMAIAAKDPDFENMTPEQKFERAGYEVTRYKPLPPKDNVVEHPDRKPFLEQQDKAMSAVTEPLSANPLAIPDFLKRKPVTAKAPLAVTTPNGPAWPDGYADPDAFLKRLDVELSKLSDGDAMQALWDERVEPLWANMFPPDRDECQKLMRHHTSQVAP